MIERPGNVKSLKIPSRLPVLGCGSFKTESNITQVCKRKIVHGLVSNGFFLSSKFTSRYFWMISKCGIHFM